MDDPGKAARDAMDAIGAQVHQRVQQVEVQERLARAAERIAQELVKIEGHLAVIAKHGFAPG